LHQSGFLLSRQAKIIFAESRRRLLKPEVTFVSHILNVALTVPGCHLFLKPRQGHGAMAPVPAFQAAALFHAVNFRVTPQLTHQRHHV
jgi:hypothetical protein